MFNMMYVLFSVFYDYFEGVHIYHKYKLEYSVETKMAHFSSSGFVYSNIEPTRSPFSSLTQVIQLPVYT